jgi:hypothetical protein
MLPDAKTETGLPRYVGYREIEVAFRIKRRTIQTLRSFGLFPEPMPGKPARFLVGELLRWDESEKRKRRRTGFEDGIATLTPVDGRRDPGPFDSAADWRRLIELAKTDPGDLLPDDEEPARLPGNRVIHDGVQLKGS